MDCEGIWPQSESRARSAEIGGKPELPYDEVCCWNSERGLHNFCQDLTTKRNARALPSHRLSIKPMRRAIA
ncbi:hypothetical protein L484_006423 [Morus notabilis]|uniref:Uncharacterized protein n=1 Tax=Morus notabilis TaxID=981085 RepID=W9REZ2_9ROSA|nr:hypothetical protein L484_006423 [Morus notabilis]